MVRRQLGRCLRRLRSAAKVSVDQVVANRELGISRAKLYKLEAGQHPVKPQDVVVLCQFFGASPDEIKRLTALALATQGSADAAIPEWFQLYRDLEQVAASIRSYEGEVIPGLLQTGDYARAVYQAAQPDDGEEAIKHQVNLRMERQERFFSRRPQPRLSAVLSETVLTRLVGGEAVMQAQVEQLRQLGRRDGIEIRVLPFSTGGHAAMAGDFRILDFDDPDDPDIVYLEAQIGARYLQKPSEYDEYQRLWRLIHAQAVPLKEFSP
ncbi:MAG: helix-turn-helix domain-containing protein [Micromonosporaceae bacterium]|nr:helix-turn-helix domain-containing protein [Micromonosporaceae bacterium]